MDIKEFAKALETRTRNFGVAIIRLCAKLPNTPEGKTVRTQLSKCGTSVGANYREANRLRSKTDFRNKISICESEASETQYWLEVIRERQSLTPEKLRREREECSQLLALFTFIGKK